LLVIECGLYYNCIYFFIKKNKRVWKTIYNLVMLAISCTMVVSAYGMRFWDFLFWETMLVVLAISSVVLWFVYALVPVIGLIISAVFFLFYKLNDKDVQIMAKCNSGEISREEAEKQLSRKY